MFRVSSLVATLFVAGAAIVEVRQAPPAPVEDSSPFFAGITDVASLTRHVDARLAEARALMDRLLSVKSRRTPDNTLRVYDDLTNAIAAAGGPANIAFQLHPDPAMRTAAEAAQQKVSAFATDVSLHRGIYDALHGLDDVSADADVKRYVSRLVSDYRRAGVDKDEATRERLRGLREHLTRTIQEFDRNIREGVRRIQVSASDLDGLPADFVAAHKPGAAGLITLTTDMPDVQPVMAYAKNADIRRRLFMESQNVAAPANLDVLRRMVAIRSEIARAVGFTTWAELDMDDRMSGSAAAADAFIERIAAAAATSAERDYRRLLDQKRRDDPSAQAVFAWEVAYYNDQIRRAMYAFDSQALRPYFPYQRVREGVFSVTKTLFGFDYVRAAGVPVWHPSVEVYDVFERGRRMGRLYFDMHPRAGKAGGGASTGTVRRGVAGRQLPEIVLICRFPGGQAGDPGLMTPGQVTTFFHEFGHAVHVLSSGRQLWGGLTRPFERDFIEAPSQMLEEWMDDPPTLATFARHVETNEPIPATLAQGLQRSRELGRGLQARQQMALARLSLSLHDRAPDAVDPARLHRESYTRYSPIPYPDGVSMPASFTHLSNGNYSSSYYTYMWSLVIAKDLFTAFDHSNLLAPDRAMRYRQTILTPGGSKPAADLVKDLLGRPFTIDAWETWLKTETR
jgi:thimet oligopeptidase